MLSLFALWMVSVLTSLSLVRQTLNVGAAPGEILKSFFLPETEAGSILFFYVSHEEYEIEGIYLSLFRSLDNAYEMVL